jgi:hypothetical protein
MQYKIDDTQFIYLLDISLVKEKYILFISMLDNFV